MNPVNKLDTIHAVELTARLTPSPNDWTFEGTIFANIDLIKTCSMHQHIPNKSIAITSITRLQTASYSFEIEMTSNNDVLNINNTRPMSINVNSDKYRVNFFTICRTIINMIPADRKTPPN